MVSAISINGCDWTSPAGMYIAEYETSGIGLPLHVFPPARKTPAAGWTTLLYFHGGEWQRGDPGQWHRQCRIFQRLGYLCISAGYRVAERDGTSVNEAVSDAHAALRHVRSHADDLGANPSRIVLAGGSAGGHLAALLVTGQQKIYPPEPVAALLLFNPMLNLAPGHPDHEHVADSWEILSPFHQLRAALPPTLILVGDRDPEAPLETARDFCKKARSLGSKCELYVAKGQGHGFFNYGISRWQFLRTLWVSYRFLNALRL